MRASVKLMGLTDSCGSRRAYSGWQGESVTRGDRRRCELEVRETVSAARLPARIDGAIGIWICWPGSSTGLCSLGTPELLSWFDNYRICPGLLAPQQSIPWLQ